MTDQAERIAELERKVEVITRAFYKLLDDFIEHEAPAGEILRAERSKVMKKLFRKSLKGSVPNQSAEEQA